MWRYPVVISLIASLAGFVPTPGEAQSPSQRPSYRPQNGSFEYFVARSRLTLGAGSAAELDGIGGRILWSLAPLAGERSGAVLSRLALGPYLVHTPEDREDVEMWHYGVQADVLLARAPLAGRVDPLLSLGVGAVRVEEPLENVEPVPPLLRRPDLAVDPFERTRTDLSLVPGVGARMGLLPGLDFRGDVRMVIDFRERTRRNLEVSAGLSLPV